ncbi:hypothetical protein FF011L_32360 [Roseimaritima multifibrata]|uniref:DUF1211 domain-containing protein n=1 Tax=Roseimaritima multifibrata TaxID=1930274 RepID=A0A517MI39_9BACT|nr:TMEM175 family protein [Roseimaritima multifibrata]QDS94457.1 hypothetical protein FF011L_32360 [Roseimaritima multifibrata]
MHSHLIQKDRLAALSDGVIAVMITLMFLGFEGTYQEIRDAKSSAEIWALIGQQMPQFLSYCLSFIFIGGYWLKQHLIFLHIGHVDRVFIGLNFLFLMCISMVPIATDWLVESANHEFNAIFVFYALWYTVCSLALAASWAWATTGRRLATPHLRTETVRSIYFQIAASIAACLFGVAVSYVDIRLGMIALTVTALAMLCPLRSDGHWLQADKELTEHVARPPKASREPFHARPVTPSLEIPEEAFAT